jgi:hypothetical protein
MTLSLLTAAAPAFKCGTSTTWARQLQGKTTPLNGRPGHDVNGMNKDGSVVSVNVNYMCVGHPSELSH